ncbi:enoyl-CoA hydratase/isomerase family protein [Cupriavidus alkaliphilus]|uniref:enoyl-CoA hydratase/isomerase family protein n=1 Tax=Cupriavidus alkaliphilus TaxID=942866 RepID=UPI0016215B80|nr:enoyl-CoA hydratase/isomerase family protein [Cupriavidus alkaliphilus]MBB2919340.1 enoyl-CoA hydratase/carnithine racemase [Cupriavidus alkaliphilus]
MHDGNDANDIHVQCAQFVATVEIRRPPHNHFDFALIAGLADAFEQLDRDPACRAIVLAAEGKSFCAGADFSSRASDRPRQPDTDNLYKEALRLFRARKPVVAAVHGAAIGGGLGLALAADFRVTCEEARFSANFARLGTHPGFGLTATLPRLLGPQQAALLIYTGRRVSGTEAVRIGLADVLVAQAEVRSAAWQLAAEIAMSAPRSVCSVRETLRRGLADEVERATEREFVEQRWQFAMDDFKEGVAAMAERREPVFQGK